MSYQNNRKWTPFSMIRSTEPSIESPYLSEGHDVMFNVGPSHRLRMLAVICHHDGDVWIVTAYAVDQTLQLVIAEERFGCYSDQGTDIIFWAKRNKKLKRLVYILV